ncbi:MAG TPA: DUF4175 domain-containing protein [Brevundimonas sp.]|nr:DUF4175 domain-containing protein [Brevundimonas sp.]
MAALTLLGLAFVAHRRASKIDQRWLVARLDARLDRFEDSTGLFFQPAAELDGLARLQRDRLEARIAEARPLGLRPPWSRRAIAAAWLAGLVVALAALILPFGRDAAPSSTSAGGARPVGPPQLRQARLRIIPPAYTGLPPREQTSLDARAPEGSRLEWTFAFDPEPSAGLLAFPDGPSATLTRKERRWTASRNVSSSTLYRLEATGLARQRLHRIDVTADAAPTIRLVTPNSQLVIATPGQRRWNAVFEARDDYGVEASATLRVTVSQGEGEQVTFQQRARAVRGVGDRTRKRYAVSFDLEREGLTPGSDLIVQLVVADNRASGRQVVEGPSVILRAPSQRELAAGLEGMLRPTMPAYFRSQRQIIIDAEALIARRRRLDGAEFVTRSNALGIDQAQLRLRYGQFMGEESEGGGIALPTNDPPAGPPLPTSDRPEPAQSSHHEGDGHDHGEAEAPSAGPVDAAREFGHVHDDGDSATLFDPGTRTQLSAVLDAMWGSERALRLGRPEDALPFAYRALELLKELQQADRIYLGRVGSNLPPIDGSRRLTGERDGVIAAPILPRPPGPGDTTVVEAWRALEGRAPIPPFRLDALDRWVRLNSARLSDPLSLRAAIDALRNDPGCRECRARLRGLLWTALERPPAAVRRREAAGARGQRYLDALR